MRRTLPALKLGKSPLVFVLTQIRISPVLRMEEYIPRIQERLRHIGYPRFTQSQLQQVVLGPVPTVQPEVRTSTRWLFIDRDAKAGVVVAPEFVVLETTAYETFDHFMAQLEPVLDVVGEVAEVSLSERLGLRYIDLVLPDSEESGVSRYMQPGLLGLDETELETDETVHRYELRARTGIGELVFRVARSTRGALMPPDITPLDLKLSVTEPVETPHAILDFDHFSEVPREYRPGDLIEVLWELHDHIDRAFRLAVTEYALKQWEAGER
jgi:uncharacterized protein (TIGR04255 family)